MDGLCCEPVCNHNWFASCTFNHKIGQQGYDSQELTSLRLFHASTHRCEATKSGTFGGSVLIESSACPVDQKSEAEAPLSELMHFSRPLALIGASSSFTKVRMMKGARMPIANSARIPSPPPRSLSLETGAEARLISAAHTEGAAASVIAAAAISTLRIFIIATLNSVNGAPPHAKHTNTKDNARNMG